MIENRVIQKILPIFEGALLMRDVVFQDQIYQNKD